MTICANLQYTDQKWCLGKSSFQSLQMHFCWKKSMLDRSIVGTLLRGLNCELFQSIIIFAILLVSFSEDDVEVGLDNGQLNTVLTTDV